MVYVHFPFVINLFLSFNMWITGAEWVNQPTVISIFLLTLMLSNLLNSAQSIWFKNEQTKKWLLCDLWLRKFQLPLMESALTHFIFFFSLSSSLSCFSLLRVGDNVQFQIINKQKLLISFQNKWQSELLLLFLWVFFLRYKNSIIWLRNGSRC